MVIPANPAADRLPNRLLVKEEGSLDSSVGDTNAVCYLRGIESD